ncbi:hypothetical protein FRC08_014408 [Ceratobasidium sp. 394]|nr:hypothetical protein FRC08_014408 [Ceratobasidium sp. 394]
MPDFDLNDLYGDHPIRRETFNLDNEDPHKARRNSVKVRALNEFIMVKGGKFVYPMYNLSTPEWWEGVEVYGYMACPVGDSRWHIWSGHWAENFGDRHFELVRIDRVSGICKESNQHWRCGKEKILWLETAQHYAYALTVPAEPYAGSWPPVLLSWTDIKDNPGDPTFEIIDPLGSRAPWWGKEGTDAWDHIRKQALKSQKKGKAQKRTDGEGEGGDRQRSSTEKTKGRRVGDKAAPPTRKGKDRPVSQGHEGALQVATSSTAPQSRGKRQREQLGGTESEGREPISEEESPPPRAPKRARKPPSSNSPALSPPKPGSKQQRDEAKLRAQREADGFSPGPATQEKSAMPPCPSGRKSLQLDELPSGAGTLNPDSSSSAILPASRGPTPLPDCHSQRPEVLRRGPLEEQPGARLEPGHQGDHGRYHSSLSSVSTYSPPRAGTIVASAGLTELQRPDTSQLAGDVQEMSISPEAQPEGPGVPISEPGSVVQSDRCFAGVTLTEGEVSRKRNSTIHTAPGPDAPPASSAQVNTAPPPPPFGPPSPPPPPPPGPPPLLDPPPPPPPRETLPIAPGLAHEPRHSIAPVGGSDHTDESALEGRSSRRHYPLSNVS